MLGAPHVQPLQHSGFLVHRGKVLQEKGMNAVDVAKARGSFYAFLGLHFLELPDESFVAALQSGQFRDVLQELARAEEVQPEIAEGALLMQGYLDSAQSLDAGEVANRLGVDRTRLYRGVSPHQGPIPPYESLWITGGKERFVLQEISGIYARNGFALKADTHERLDYIGIQMNFMERLVGNEVSALLAGDALMVQTSLERETEFFCSHLGLWAPRFVLSALEHAETDFYTGHLHMLKGFFEQERGRCCRT